MSSKVTRTLPLRHTIFRVLVGAILLTSIIILINVWTATSSLVNKQLDKELNVARNVLSRLLTERTQRYKSVGEVLAKDWAFRTAYATEDWLTVESTFDSQSKRIDADLMMVVGLDQNIITSQPEGVVPKNQPFSYPELLEQTLETDTGGGLVLFEHSLFQLILNPIRVPSVLGYLVIGFDVNRSFLSGLREITQADIIIYRYDVENDNAADLIASSLSDSEAIEVLEHSGAEVSWLAVTQGRSHSYATRALDIPQLSQQGIFVLLAVDVSAQYDNFTQLQITILSISLIAILVSLGLALLLSNRVSQPLNQLVNVVENVARGEYEQDISAVGQIEEIQHLEVAFKSMQENIRSREERIRFQAQHDMLTGLYNRNYIEGYIERLLHEQAKVQVIGISIVGFRTINDLYGYSNGDKCLQRTAERLMRWSGTAARLSGGELLWIAQEPLNEMQLETLHHILEQPVETNDVMIPLRTVFGVIECPEQANTTEDIFRKMNIVLDEVKHSSEWLIRYRPELENNYLRRLSIITALKQALISEQHEFSMVYQPKVNLKTRHVTGVEALIRWNSAQLGFVPPDEFIGVAEHAGLIDQVTIWVMQQVLNDLAAFRRDGYVFTAAINLSTQDIENRPLLDRFESMLRDAGLKPSDFVLEITESDLVADAKLAIANLERLREQGFALSIDDFGTGYSSLAYLKNLPVQSIKIDKSFVLNLPQDKSDQQIVKTVLNLAEVFGLSVVAEGIEDETTMDLLTEWRCDLAQGYFISKPLASRALRDWLEETSFSHGKVN